MRDLHQEHIELKQSIRKSDILAQSRTCLARQIHQTDGMFFPYSLCAYAAYLIVASVLTLWMTASGLAQEVREIQLHRTSNGVRYGLIQTEQSSLPAPTLFVFAHAIEEMRKQVVYTEVSKILAARGWISVIIDPPCHGEDVRDGEPPQLEGWRFRLEHEDDFVKSFTSKASSVLDQLIQDGLTDPERIAACGTSRGGFLAYHFAAADTRVKAAGGISPVTRLTALREFSATTQREAAEQLNVAQLAAKLVNRGIWLSIGNNDARVDTDDAIAFTRAVVQASKQPDKPNQVIPIELIVGPSTGHSKINQAHELLADWLSRQIPK